jgi:hypothetical protein
MKTKITITLAIAGALVLPALSFAKEHEEEQNMSMSQLPAAVQNGVKAKIGESKVVRIEKEDEHGSTTYEVVVMEGKKEKGMEFDQNGKFLKSHYEKGEKGEKEEHEKH